MTADLENMLSDCDVIAKRLERAEADRDPWNFVGVGSTRMNIRPLAVQWLTDLLSAANRVSVRVPYTLRDVMTPTSIADALVFVKALKAWAEALPPIEVDKSATTTTPKLTLDERALAFFVADRTRSKTQIAKLLGLKNTQSIAPDRCPRLHAAMQACKALDLPNGSKSKDGTIEAWEDDR